jgi:anti-sigma factor RsiW
MNSDDLSQIENQFSAYLDGELNDEQRRQVEHVLAENPRSRQLLAELRQTARLVSELPKAKAPADLAQQITAAVDRAAPPQPRSARRIRWPLWLGTSGAVAAALLLVVALIQFHGPPSEQAKTEVADRSLPEGSKPMATEKGPRGVAPPADALARSDRDTRALSALGYTGMTETASPRTLTVTVPDADAGATAAEWLTTWAESNAAEGFSASSHPIAEEPNAPPMVLACYRMELDPQQVGQLAGLTEQWSQQLRSPQQTMRMATMPTRGAPKVAARYYGNIVGEGAGAEQPAAKRKTAAGRAVDEGENVQLEVRDILKSEQPAPAGPGAVPVLAAQPVTRPTEDKKTSQAQPVLVVIRLASPTTQPTAGPAADD